MRGKRRAMAQMNVVPYIDVMLVLLVIFMVAAPMMQPGDAPLHGMSLRLRNWPPRSSPHGHSEGTWMPSF